MLRTANAELGRGDTTATAMLEALRRVLPHTGRGPAIVETFACNWCSRHLPGFRVHRLASNQVMCDYCLDWHEHAIAFLGGAPPRGCQVCLNSWELLKASTPGEQVRLYVVPKDGIYQLLCAACVTPYLPRRADLYKGTQFGSQTLKLL